MSQALNHEMFDLSLQAVKALLRVFRAEAFDWTIQDGEAAGQTVPHVHLHLIPRIKEDLPDPGDWYPELENLKANIDSARRPRLSESEVRTAAEKIMEEIKRLKE